MTELKIEENVIQNVFRLNKASSTDRIPPVIITLNQEINRNIILKAAKNLYNINKFKGIFINPDLTEAERPLDKQLRLKRNELNEEEIEKNQPFRWGIRGDKVIRFAKFPHNK